MARLLKTQDEREFWRSAWTNALRNMPTKEPGKRKGEGLEGNYGAQSMLAKFLGYQSHQGVYNGYRMGGKPKGDRANKLLKLAGPHGRTLALLHLRRFPNLRLPARDRWMAKAKAWRAWVKKRQLYPHQDPFQHEDFEVYYEKLLKKQLKSKA